MDDGVKQMTEKVEYMFLKKIISGLEDGIMDPAQAQDYAKAFIAIEPFTSFEDAQTKIKQFAEQVPVFAELKDYIDAYHDEQKVDSVIQKMQEYIGQDKIEEAIQVAQPQ